MIGYKELICIITTFLACLGSAYDLPYEENCILRMQFKDMRQGFPKIILKAATSKGRNKYNGQMGIFITFWVGVFGSPIRRLAAAVT